MGDSLETILKNALNRTVPIADPQYIIGEEESIREFDTWVAGISNEQQGVVGSVVLGQVGNGKTHLLRFVRREYSNRGYIGIYIPDMFVNGPLVNALNGIYKSFFVGSENNSLKDYCDIWDDFIKGNGNREVLLKSNNEIIRYLLICNNKEERELVLDYFSNKDLFPDQLKYLRSKFGAKKNFINNENDFAQYIGDSIEFLQLITKKTILLFFDEVDKVYSSETRSPNLTKVGLKILSAYRGLFDLLNRKGILGVLCVGATPEAWEVLSTYTAFERRFKDRTILLKVPKTKNDCVEFIFKRFDEINFLPEEKDKEIIRNMINDLDESQRKTWADVISNLRNTKELQRTVKTKEPAELIIEVLEDAIGPLTWAEIIEENDQLKSLYPHGQPTSILNKLTKEGFIRINSTAPKTYEIIRGSEEVNDD